MFDSSVEGVMQEAALHHLSQLYVGQLVKITKGPYYTKRFSVDPKGTHTIESVSVEFYDWSSEDSDVRTYGITFTLLSKTGKSRTRINWF